MKPLEHRVAAIDMGRWIVGCIAALLAVSWTPKAHAQPIEGEFSVQRLSPAPGPRNYVATRGARTDGEMAFSVGLLAHYAYKPFVVRSCENSPDCSDPDAREIDVNVVENLLTGDLLGTLTPIPRLQIGLRIPVSFAEGDGLTEEGIADIDNAIKGTGLGDVELEAKVRLHGEPKDPFVVGASVFGTGPTGKATAEGNFIGDRSVTAGIRAIFDGQQGPLSFGGNLGYAYRKKARVGATDLGQEAIYSLGAGYAVSPLVRVMVDGFGTTRFSSDTGNNALELVGALRITPLNSGFAILLGGGAGLIQGVGVPKGRALLGFSYLSEHKDRDEDGINDDDDQCPTEPEDKDDFEDTDGCPDPDNDGDTIVDTADKCPNTMEDPDGFEDEDGCPEEDNDKDGLADISDRCPLEPETKNNFEDEDGCPDQADSDADGIVDDDDKCPTEKEDTDGFEDMDGCPEPDNDQDGIPDNLDECPDQPETINKKQDTDGCPD